jgi:hypothetical protein
MNQIPASAGGKRVRSSRSCARALRCPVDQGPRPASEPRRARRCALTPLIARISARPKRRRSTRGAQPLSRLLSLKYQWGSKRVWCAPLCEVLVRSVLVMLALSPQDVFC